MSNPKTMPCPPKPVPQSGWVHKCDLDDYLDRHLPIPTQVVSNEEYYPLPQTVKQKAVEHHLSQMATRNAKKLGIDRREFLRSAGGMAAAFTAMNEIFGDFFRVEATELTDAGAAAERKVDYFIFDVQTHHVAVDRWKLFDVNSPHRTDVELGAEKKRPEGGRPLRGELHQGGVPRQRHGCGRHQRCPRADG